MSRLLLNQSVQNPSSHVLIRSKLRAVSRRLAFDDVMRERLELVTNELVTNQVKFADGSGFLQIWETDSPVHCLDIFAMDYGPGIPHLTKALQDGFSTVSTLGKGLGAIRRLAHDSEFYTVPENKNCNLPWTGTAIWCRFCVDKKNSGTTLQTGTYLRAYQDSYYNGDYLATLRNGSLLRWLHLDGLGHGQSAAEVSSRALDLIEDSKLSVMGVMETLSHRLQGSRGAVALVCELDTRKREATITGVGDIVGHLILNGEKKSLTFSPGVLGHAHRSFILHTLQFPTQALLITASDGLRKNWTLGSFPGLWRRHPQLIALILGQVTNRGTDDCSLFVVRTTPQKGNNNGKKK